MKNNEMTGGFYCPKCKELNACNCSNCMKYKTDRKRIKWEANGEIMICAYCSRHFSPDEAMDTEYRIRKRPTTEEKISKYHRNSGLSLQEWELEKIIDRVKNEKSTLKCIKILDNFLRRNKNC